VVLSLPNPPNSMLSSLIDSTLDSIIDAPIDSPLAAPLDSPLDHPHLLGDAVDLVLEEVYFGLELGDLRLESGVFGPELTEFLEDFVQDGDEVHFGKEG